MALILSVVLALSIPFVYLIMAYEHQTTVLETEAESTASFVTQLISANPEYWRFEQPRLEGILSHRPQYKQQESRRIVDVNNVVLAQSLDAPETPLVTRAHSLYDSGTVVARIEISRSFRPYLIRALALALFGFGFGAASFFLLRVLPLRALDQALKALQDSEVKFRAIASTAADAIIVMDQRGNITFWNNAAETMFGYTREEAIGKELHLLLAPPSFHESYRRGFEHFSRTGQGPAIGNTLEFTALRKDGTQFPIEVSTSAIALTGAWHAVGIIRDITERKKTEAELLKLEKIESLGVLAGGIAHDFNNLLTVILGSVSLARRDAGLSEQSSKRLEDAERAAHRARGLTQQLLTFSKGGAPVKRTSSIREIIEESCDFSLSGSNVKCASSFGDDIRPVEVDAGQISQVMHNLMLNAVQAMPAGGTIQVTCENVAVGPGDPLPLTAGPYVKISVQDRGIGIPTENLSRIFDPYFTTKEKGSGLGLATSYSIIKQHGGDVSVESKPGVGSIFHIYLPASPQGLPARGSEPKGLVRGKGRILLMDDEESVCEVAGEMLKALGYEPAYARDGAEALQLYREAAEDGAPFHTVIMDLTIPGGMGGKEAIKLLRKLDPGARVVVASGYSNDPIMAEFRTYGFSGVMAKPYTLETLDATLRTVMA